MRCNNRYQLISYRHVQKGFSYIYLDKSYPMNHLSRKKIKAIKLLFHFCFLGYISFALINTGISFLPVEWLFYISSDAVENLITAIIAYTSFYIVFKLNFNWKKLLIMVFFSFVLTGLALIKDYRIHQFISFDFTFRYFSSFLGKSLLFYLLLYTINKFEQLNSYKNLESELRNTQEQLLRSQLHPHFLFNAFNSLYSLSLKNDTSVSEYILKLSGMMRYLTDEKNLSKVPLDHELNFIKQYISIEKLRFGQEANIIFTIESNEEDFPLIEPFLLIPIVENAFKHGFYTNAKDAFIHIILKLGNRQLFFSVSNKKFRKQHYQEKTRKGKGLIQLQQRLQLLYPNNSYLQIEDNEELYTANISINL